MNLLAILQVLADIPPEEEATADTPWLAVIVVMILAFSWSASMIGAHVNAFSEQLYARIERGYER